ncbi:MAG TPA: thioredoxin domain-containing protein [Spirillospora sp.]
MGNPPNAPWPGQGAQPPPGPPPGPPDGPGWRPPGPYTPPPPGGGGAGKVALLVGLVAGGLVLVLVVAVVVFVVTGEEDGGPGGGGEVRLRVGKIAGGAEATPLPDGALVMARPGVTSPVVDVYEDFACPHCGDFDRMHDPMLKQLAVSGQAKIVFRPMVIFSPGNEPAYGNSLRAASALRCVGDGAAWLAYQDALYRHQPATLQTPGYRIDDLLRWASGIVSEKGFRSCVENQRYAEDVKEVSRRYIGSGISSTPAVRVNGRTLGSQEIASADALRRAIEAAS